MIREATSHLFASLMHIYESWFGDDDAFHPATYPAVVITIALSFLTIAVVACLDRIGVDTRAFDELSKLQLFLISATFYVIVASAWLHNDNWKSALSDFRALSRSKQTLFYALDALLFFGSLIWMVVELFFLY